MRFLDIIASSLGLILLSPLLLVVALAVKLSSRGPIFYRGPRVGRFGRPFRIYKFRSMVAHASGQGPAVTTADDSRVTAVGRFLRRHKLDELPQFINVMIGDMALVGPRPEDPRYVALYTPEQRQVLNVRPGITSVASLHYRNEERLLSGADWEKTYIEKVMPHKLSLEIEYLRTRGFWSDVGILLKTLWHLIRRPRQSAEAVFLQGAVERAG